MRKSEFVAKTQLALYDFEIRQFFYMASFFNELKEKNNLPNFERFRLSIEYIYKTVLGVLYVQ